MSKLQFSPRPNKKELDETTSFAPKFDDMGLIAAMAIDHETREPLMLAYMNEESLKMTIEMGEAVYYSRSRQEIWHKGATSGHTQKIHEIRTLPSISASIVVHNKLSEFFLLLCQSFR